MTITLSAWWLHGAATLGMLVWVIGVVSRAGDYDFSAPAHAAVPVILYLLYWIIFLALT